MNITYILGNGLDLQYDLATRYKDFYKYQHKEYEVKQKQENFNYIYDALFSDKVHDYENWSDFEWSIGDLTKTKHDITDNEETKEKFIEDFADVINDLRYYLHEVQNSFDIENKSIDFEKTLSNLVAYIPSLHQNRVSQLLTQNFTTDDRINLLTLNYTDVFDRLYNQSTKVISNKLKHSTYRFRLSAPLHVHGTLEENTVLGVSDSEQLSEKFSEEQQENFVKKSSLIAFRENLDAKTTEIISSSDLIIIYGVSLGVTDEYLWKQIAEKSLQSNVPIIIYHYVENYDPGNQIRVRRLYKSLEDRFIQNCGIDLEHEKKLRQNLITVIGKQIFPLKTKEGTR